MVVLTKKKGENTESLLKRFNKITKDENISFDISKKKFFMKPSLLRKEKHKERLRRKALMRNQAS
ncbi:30S ribosomal protein S21 [Candidatus Roizmanbacteria bacterium RIFCSPHIGHO2_02_FULL_40_9]|uniref:Small ribosomal subunit protein bS21 n=2 Tax=Candidatus Roizmaniibacteriota TaxID=1752723 RepID=A0A1F7IMD1_9BACT|nr:MAG: 30S ribosomal protein S21 [Candidatus Roizmanbacteria bacterium RIFCSPHIGHO2_02_FULL_40_9]OGK44521.1 MAG: 30S ribosomal protein S21 [Candidatus Roizmanbacteria bacterium RIFCSPLOWO2_01_FULL_38_11]